MFFFRKKLPDFVYRRRLEVVCLMLRGMMLKEMIQTGLTRQIQKMRKEASKKVRDKVPEKTIRGMRMMKSRGRKTWPVKMQGNR